MCNFSLFAFCVVFCISIFSLEKVRGQISGAREILPINYPWHASVETKKSTCSGILISKYYVITSAYCVNGSSTATVYLGFRGSPLYVSNHQEKETQIIESNEIILHEDFKELNDFRYLNDIALIKLSTPAVFTNSIQAGILAGEESYFVDGKIFEITGWNFKSDSNLSLVNMEFLNNEKCEIIKTFFKQNDIKNQTFCLKNNFFGIGIRGNSVSSEKRIIGFLTAFPCQPGEFTCDEYHFALNIVPYINWISFHTNIDIKKLTGGDNQPNQNVLKLLKQIKVNQGHLHVKIDKLAKKSDKDHKRLERMEDLLEKL